MASKATPKAAAISVGYGAHLATAVSTKAVFEVRLATQNDVPGILALLNNKRGMAYLKHRSSEDVAESIRMDSGVVVCSSTNGEIEGYIEALSFVVGEDNEEVRNKIVWSEYGRVVPCQEGDVFFLLGAMVAREGLSKIPKVIHPWFRDNLGPMALEALSKGNKVTVLFAAMTEIKPKSTSIVKNLLDAMLGNIKGAAPRWPYYQREFPATMPDGSGRTGSLILLHADPKLTPNQSIRLSRNACLIQEVEQRRLLKSTIGVVGLSTGSVALEVMLRQGVGGTYRIADHDVFELSNANRMFYGISDVNQPKVDLCANKIRDVDPHLRIDKYPEGITSQNIEEFVKGCDLIVEECDDFAIKFQLRLVAKKYKVPLVMGTSQNGMIDIERYDIDPDCKPFHLEDFPSNLDGQLSHERKKELLSKMFEPDQFSPRMLQALPKVGKSIPSWPQLAEEVTLNAATLAHAARRILLGDDKVISGRFGIRLDELFQPHNRLYPSAKM